MSEREPYLDDVRADLAVIIAQLSDDRPLAALKAACDAKERLDAEVDDE